MKKFITLTLVAVMLVLIFASCESNMSVGIGSYNFTHAHIAVGGDASQCVEIERWYNDEYGIELRTTSNGSIYCSEGTYILFTDASTCPYCH